MRNQTKSLCVRVVYKTERKKYVLRWIDPDDGSERQETTDATTRKEAERLAGRREQDLLDGRYDQDGRVTWKHARQRFEDEKLSELAPATIDKYRGALNEVERTINPHSLRDVDAARVSKHQAKLRERGLRPATIHSRLACLKAFLRWCVDMEWIIRAPRIRMPSIKGHTKRMRGRAVTNAEFARMQDAVEAEVGEEAAAEWKHYLRGMFLSGLRCEESLKLCWDQDGELRIDLTLRHPMLRIWSEHEKGRKDRLIPITPDFAKFLEETPESERTGRVFKLRSYDRTREAPVDWVSRVAGRIGMRAQVVVNEQAGKYASLHDLRRAFGARWALRVPMHVLQELMRHASLTTTMDYYVGQDAERSADFIWNAYEQNRGTNRGTEKDQLNQNNWTSHAKMW